MDKDRADFLNALTKVQDRLWSIRNRVANGDMTIEQAGVKLRSHSIELGSVACMPFRSCEAQSER